MRKRLFIADDHALMLSGISQLLARDFDIVGTASDGITLVREVTRVGPDLIVLDIGMPGLNGIDATRLIQEHLPSSVVVVLTQQLSGNHVQAAFRAGAKGYVAKQAAGTELLECIHAVLSGRFFVTPLILKTEKLLSKAGILDQNPADLFASDLTTRQKDVLKLIATGQSAKEIATTLGISTKTVEFHKANLMDQLGLRTTAELTRYSIENGIGI